MWATGVGHGAESARNAGSGRQKERRGRQVAEAPDTDVPEVPQSRSLPRSGGAGARHEETRTGMSGHSEKGSRMHSKFSGSKFTTHLLVGAASAALAVVPAAAQTEPPVETDASETGGGYRRLRLPPQPGRSDRHQAHRDRLFRLDRCHRHRRLSGAESVRGAPARARRDDRARKGPGHPRERPRPAERVHLRFDQQAGDRLGLGAAATSSSTSSLRELIQSVTVQKSPTAGRRGRRHRRIGLDSHRAAVRQSRPAPRRQRRGRVQLDLREDRPELLVPGQQDFRRFRRAGLGRQAAAHQPHRFQFGHQLPSDRTLDRSRGQRLSQPGDRRAPARRRHHVHRCRQEQDRLPR